MDPPRKKKKGRYGVTELKTIGNQLLLTFVSPSSPPHHVLESLFSHHSFFLPLLPKLPSSSAFAAPSIVDDQSEFIYLSWLHSKFDEFLKSLLDVLTTPQGDETLKELVLDMLMEFVKVANGGTFHSSLYQKLLHSIIDLPDKDYAKLLLKYPWLLSISIQENYTKLLAFSYSIKVETVAQFGVIFLLFALGLELSTTKVTQDGKYCLVLVFGAKALQLSGFEQRQTWTEAKFSRKFREVQPKTVLKFGKNGCPKNNVSSETTVAKHRSYLQKGRGVTPKVPTEGKLIDNNNAQGHNFKHKIGEGAKSEARTARPMYLRVSLCSGSPDSLPYAPTFSSVPFKTHINGAKIPVILDSMMSISEINALLVGVNVSETMMDTGKKKKGRYGVAELKTLGNQLLPTFVSPSSPPHHVLESLLSLHSFFLPLLPKLPSPSASAAPSVIGDQSEFSYLSWLRYKFDEFLKSLLDVLASPQGDETLKELVLDTLVEFVKVANGGAFHSSLYHKLLHSIVLYANFADNSHCHFFDLIWLILD
ncbi:hypothetical protein D0Y65_023972 [Glycine soja]|uniref:Uncharacterized protein n=1 Tax=Glycine soja TaxID=3848 RepID=A0A445J092_GLYSO|nr:hypothetical protein D0Y65_023972 [Glycine soja]